MVGVGVPNLVSFGVTTKLTRFFGIGANVGLIPKVKISYYGEATLSYQEVDVYGRIYPFGGSFFLGAGVGYATVAGTFAETVNVTVSGNSAVVDVSSDGKVRSLVLTPQLGLFHTFGSGFSLGIDVGAQVPIAPSEISFENHLPAQVPPSYAANANEQTRSTLQRIGQQVVPTLNLRVGWLLLTS